MSNLKKIKSDLIFLCNTTYKIDDHEWLEREVEKAFTILKYFEDKKESYNKNLSQQIDATINLFELVNKYESNRGFKKLAKQANLLKIQYEKYKANKKIKSNLRDFFDNYSGERAPLRENILTLTAHNIKQIFILKDKIETKKAKEMADNIVKIVLNYDKKFARRMLYKGITIEVNEEEISLNYISKDYWKNRYMYFNNN